MAKDIIYRGSAINTVDGTNGIKGKNGLDAPSLVPKGKWSSSENYVSSTRFADLVFVGDNPDTAQWYVAKRSHRGVRPPNSTYWESVGRTKWLIAASGIFGKISADQIEVSAFDYKLKELPKDYNENDIANLVKNRTNYYFFLRDGDIKLPFLNKTNIEVGTDVTFLIPDTGSCQVRYFLGQIPKKNDFSDIIADPPPSSGPYPMPVIRYTVPVCKGFLQFKVAQGRNGKEWLWINSNEFKDIDAIEKNAEKAVKIENRTGVNTPWQKRTINGNDNRIDLDDCNYIQVADYKQGSDIILKLFSGHTGNDVWIDIPTWVKSAVILRIYEGKYNGKLVKTYRFKSGLYKLLFYGLADECHLFKVSDVALDPYKEPPLPGPDPWERPGWLERT